MASSHTKTESGGAIKYELKMSAEDYLLEPINDDYAYEEGVKLNESVRISESFAWSLSTASDICERRRNINDLKVLDPMFPP
jgi:hypothetical protein